MEKEEAARYLGVSVRAVERYAARGKLTARHEGEGRVVYDEGEVRLLRVEMDGRALPARPALGLAHKRTLSLDEAATLSGLARKVLLHSILEGRLRVQVGSPGYRVARDELDDFARAQ